MGKRQGKRKSATHISYSMSNFLNLVLAKLGNRIRMNPPKSLLGSYFEGSHFRYFVGQISSFHVFFIVRKIGQHLCPWFASTLLFLSIPSTHVLSFTFLAWFHHLKQNVFSRLFARLHLSRFVLLTFYISLQGSKPSTGWGPVLFIKCVEPQNKQSKACVCFRNCCFTKCIDPLKFDR